MYINTHITNLHFNKKQVDKYMNSFLLPCKLSNRKTKQTKRPLFKFNTLIKLRLLILCQCLHHGFLSTMITARSESQCLSYWPNMNDVYSCVEIICYPNRAFEKSFIKTVQLASKKDPGLGVIIPACSSWGTLICGLILDSDLGFTLNLWDSGFSSIKWGFIFPDWLMSFWEFCTPPQKWNSFDKYKMEHKEHINGTITLLTSYWIDLICCLSQLVVCQSSAASVRILIC